jgi:AmmeMemoRadiSam system protein A
MGPAGSPEAAASQYSEAERATLLDVARHAIEAAASGQRAPIPELAKHTAPLRAERACFVTLEIADSLRGCIGSLKAKHPLVVEVAQMARAAAMEDPRFPPVTAQELGTLKVSISVLSEPEAVTFSSEQDLVQKLRPGVDGLILRDGWHSGTFLPSVWEKLPRPIDFWRQLKRKAGLPADHWSSTVVVERYTTESFSGGWWS